MNSIIFKSFGLIGREGNILYIDNPDMLDETLLLDIKPYIPDFDSYPEAVAGWQEKHRKKVLTQKSDNRFSQE